MARKIYLMLFAVAAIASCWWLAIHSISQTRVEDRVAYTDSQYGFNFALPEDWAGYSIVTSEWEGYGTGPIEHGPLLSIRNPKWLPQNPRQDIPIMVFTLAQWSSLQRNQFHIGAAPINPTELGRTTQYVFALPARYNFAFPTGWEEVQAILDGHPLTVSR